MTIAQDDIEKIAELARIRISGEEIGEVTQRITEILQMVDTLQAADTSNVEPMANPLDATQRCAQTKSPSSIAGTTSWPLHRQ